MEQNKSTMAVAIVEAVAAVFMLLAVKVIAPVCTGMVETAAGKQVPMRCHYTEVAATLFAMLLLVNAVVCFVTKPRTGMPRRMPGAVAVSTAGTSWNMPREIHFRVLYQRH